MGTRLKRTRSTSEMLSLFLVWKTQNPGATPGVKRTPTTESLVELENEKRAVYRTSHGKIVAHVPRTSRHHVQREGETARKIICPTESDEMNVKRIVRYLKGAPSAECLIEIVTHPKFVNVHTDSDWAGQPTTCKSTCGGVVQWGNETLTARSRTQQTVSLSSAGSELYALTNGLAKGMVTKHLLEDLGHGVTLMNHVDSQSAKALASRRGLGRTKHGHVEIHARARCSGKEAEESCITSSRN